MAGNSNEQKLKGDYLAALGAFEGALTAKKIDKKPVTEQEQIQRVFYEHAVELKKSVEKNYKKMIGKPDEALIYYLIDVLKLGQVALKDPGNEKNRTELWKLADKVPGKDTVWRYQLAVNILNFIVWSAVVVIVLASVPTGGLSLIALIGVALVALVNHHLHLEASAKLSIENAMKLLTTAALAADKSAEPAKIKLDDLVKGPVSVVPDTNNKGDFGLFSSKPKKPDDNSSQNQNTYYV